MDDFLILLQAKLDEAKSKGNINADIDKIQGQLDKLKIQAEIDPKTISSIVSQMSKLGIQVGKDFGKAFNNGLSSTINTNVLNQINKISDSSASTIVQNEKKKQDAYKATSDAVVYHAGIISKLNKAETNGRFYGSSRGTGYFGTGHYFVDSNTKHELDNNSSYSKLPYTSVDISKYDNLFKATTDKIASKLHNFLENLTRFTQGSDRFNIDELFSQFKNVFTDTTMDIKDFGDKMEQLKTFMSNSNLSDRSDSVSTQFMKSLGYGGVDTRGTKYADTRYGTVIYDLKEESVLQANITDELQKQGQMLEKINYEKGQVFDSSTDVKIQEQIDAQRRLAEVQAEFKNSFNTDKLDFSEEELNNAQKRLTEIDNIIADCQHEIDHADEAAKQFAKDMSDLGFDDMSDAEMKDWKERTVSSYQNRIDELSLERAELEKRIPVLEENYNKESQLASEAYKQAEQIVEQRRLESQQSSSTANEVIQNEEKKQQAIQKTYNSYKSFSELKIGTGNVDAIFNKDGILDAEKSLNNIKQIYSEFGQVKITDKIFDPEGNLQQFKVNIQQVNGELKESRSFMMALSSDGKSFSFPQDVIKGSESFVHHLNEAKNVSNATGEELNAQKAKLAEQEKYYSRIKSEVTLLYNLEQKLLSADELQTAELEKQIKSTKQRITYNNQQIDKKNLRDDSFDREITNLEVAKQKQLALSEARIQDSVNIKAVNAALKEQQSLQSQANKIQLSLDTSGYESKVESLIAKTQQWTDKNGEARISTNTLSIALENLKTASTTLSNNNTVENQKALISAEKELDTQIKTVTNSVRSMNAELAKDSSISSLHNKVADFMSKNGKTVKYYGTELNRIFNETAQGASLTDAQVRQLNQDFNNTVITARNAGKLGKTFFQTIREGMSSFSYWTSSTFLVMKAIQSVKGGINDVKELDTALVDLKKTTTMTANELKAFYYASNDVAKQMGVTTEEIINQAAAWSRFNNIDPLYGDI